MKKNQLPIYIRILVFVLIFYFSWQILVLTRTILIPVILALLLAIVLYPVQNLLESKWKLPKGLSALISTFLFILFLSGVVFFIAGEASAFSADINLLAKKFSETGNSFNPGTGNLQLDIFLSKSINSLFGFFSTLISRILVSTFSTLITTVLTVVFTFFFLFYRTFFYSKLTELLGNNNTTQFTNSLQTQFTNSLHAIRNLIRHFITGILIEILIVAVLNATLLSIFGIKHGIMLGVLAALLNVIPYVGIYSATLLAVLVSYGDSGPASALTTAIIFLSVHTIDANIIMPRIIGSQVKLNSFVALLSVLLWGIIWGVPGLFLAIPVSAIAKIIFEHIDSLKPFAALMGTEKSKSAPLAH